MLTRGSSENSPWPRSLYVAEMIGRVGGGISECFLKLWNLLGSRIVRDSVSASSSSRPPSLHRNHSTNVAMLFNFFESTKSRDFTTSDVTPEPVCAPVGGAPCTGGRRAREDSEHVHAPQRSRCNPFPPKTTPSSNGADCRALPKISAPRPCIGSVRTRPGLPTTWLMVARALPILLFVHGETSQMSLSILRRVYQFAELILQF